MSKTIGITLNGERYNVEIEDHWTLLYVLRNRLGMMGVKEGCGGGDCGACSVFIDGKVINSCLYLAPRAEGKEILTIEGMANKDQLNTLQKKFLKHGAFQCGYCTPGMIISATEVLKENPCATKEEIKREMAGNLCRCTGYVKIVGAIHDAGKEGCQQ
jgi:carbon-monoxide dehydrogenase small subunit